MATLNKIAITITDDGSADGPKVTAGIQLAVPGVIVNPTLPVPLTPVQAAQVTALLQALRTSITESVRAALVLVP